MAKAISSAATTYLSESCQEKIIYGAAGLSIVFGLWNMVSVLRIKVRPHTGKFHQKGQLLKDVDGDRDEENGSEFTNLNNNT